MRFVVRRLAAIDMHGISGSPRRAHLVRAEFVGGAAGCLALGVLSLASGSGAVPTAFGVWLVGIGLNYVPLAVHAHSLLRPGALEAELSGVDVRKEIRYYGRAQLWLAVPLVVAVLAVVRRRGT